MRPRRSPRVWRRDARGIRRPCAPGPRGCHRRSTSGRGGDVGERGDVRIGWRRGSGFGVNDANANVRRLGARARGEVEGRRERGRARGVEDTHVHGVSAVSLALVLPVLVPELLHLRRLRVGEPARLVPIRGRARGCPNVRIFRRGRLARGAKRGDRLRRRGRGRGNLLHQTHGARARNSAGSDHDGTRRAVVEASMPAPFSKSSSIIGHRSHACRFSAAPR